MSNEQRTARERIEAVVMGLIASTSDEARGLSSAKTADDVRSAAIAIATDVAHAQVAILVILNNMESGATAL